MASVRVAKPAVVDLSAIATALADEDAATALDAALVAWRQTRATALADLIDVIGSKIAAEPLDDETTWSAAARDRDPAELGALLAAIPTLPASFLPQAGEALAAFPDDPRIALATATWTLDPPTTSSTTHPFWTKVLDALGRTGDARTLPIIEQRLKRTRGGSKFWPRLYAALEKARAKIEKVPSAPVDAKAIAKLVKAARQLAVGEPSKPAKRVETTAPALSGPSLAQAIEHLDAGRLPAAIEAMVTAWRELGRVPAIADAIDRATKLLPAWDAPLGLDDKSVQAGWDAAFGDPQATMPQLLENLVVGGPKVAERHLLELGSLPDDPRIAMRLTELCSGRIVSPERTQFWKSLLELLDRIKDPRVAPALRATFRDFSGDYYNHHRQARRIIGPWAGNPPPPPALGAAEAADLAKLGAKLGKLEARRDPTERDLLKAIIETWDDAAPRLVYADWLAERQHPRGEVIVLACKDQRSPTEDKRLRELLRKVSNLFGVLEGVAYVYDEHRGLALDRGMPTAFDVKWGTSPVFWKRLRGDPLLSTIAEITFDANPMLPDPQDFAAVLLDPTARRLEKIASAPQDFWTAVKGHVDGKWKQKGTSLVRA